MNNVADILRDYFLPYQRAWIADEVPMKLAEKSRRVGYTYATSFRAVWKCARRAGHTQWVSSRDLLTAKEFLRDYVARWCRLLNIVARGMQGEQVLAVDPERDLTAFECVFPNGSRILSLSSTPEAFAGKGGDVLLDEVDLHRDPGRLVDMALPCTTWGGQLEAVSAYRVDGSRSSVWAKLVEQAQLANSQGWSLHRCTLADAVAQGLVEKINAASGRADTREGFVAAIRARCRTEDAYRSQYLCQPSDDGGALLPYGMITACEAPWDELRPAADAAQETRGPRYLGMDIGRKHDLSVIWVVELLGDVAWTREVAVLERCPFHAQLDALGQRLQAQQVRRVCVDATGIGAMLAEEAQRRWGQSRVEAVQFTAAVKEELAATVLQRFQDRQVRVPADPVVREDLHKVEKIVTAAGNVRYAAPSDEAGHADRFFALALALHAAGTGNVLVDGLRIEREDPWARSGRAPRLARTDAERRAQLEDEDHPRRGVEALTW